MMSGGFKVGQAAVVTSKDALVCAAEAELRDAGARPVDRMQIIEARAIYARGDDRIVVYTDFEAGCESVLVRFRSRASESTLWRMPGWMLIQYVLDNGWMLAVPVKALLLPEEP